MKPVLYYIQVIDAKGGEYGADRVPVPVNRRMAVTQDGPEQWCYHAPLWHQIAAAPRNSTGKFDERYSWIKE